MSDVLLKKGRATPVLRRHPWIFSGSIYRIDGDPENGDIVDVHDAGHNWLARGYINQESQITVRLLTWDQGESIDTGFWYQRLKRSAQARQALADDPGTTAYRVVHAESDYLPGLIVDRYGDWLVVQFLTLGMDRRRAEITGILGDVLAPAGVYERSDVDVREKEGLEQRTGLLWGQEPPYQIEIRENERRFLVNVREGHKTGFYLDQRENRAQLTAWCRASDLEGDMLDAFAYSGAFATHALSSHLSRLTLVDSSGPSLDLARQNIALNGRPGAPQADYVEGDVFTVLRSYRAEGRQFDLIVLDPPKLAQTRRDVEPASRADKDINLLAFQLLRPGGLLFTFSCSGRVSADLFQKIVFGALVDTGRQGQIVGQLAQGRDHPVALTFPEGAYLKGLICRVV